MSALNSSMSAVPVPETVRKRRPDTVVAMMGPPPGVSDTDCETVEALTGLFLGMPGVADYFRPDDEQLDTLRDGGVIEFVQYAPRMVMHSVSVWPAAERAPREYEDPATLLEDPDGAPYPEAVQLFVGRLAAELDQDAARRLGLVAALESIAAHHGGGSE